MRGICPEGFHLPSYWEWQDLFKAVGGESIAARDLKSTEVWADTAKGTNKYGYSVIPNGPRYGGVYNPIDFNTNFWTSIESGKNTIVTIGFIYDDKANSMFHENKEYAFSVRCLMDYPEQETPHSGIPHDPDKIYVQDTGLFVAMLERGSAAKILSGDMGFYKGAIYENIIADCFSKQNRKLFYFHKDSGLEIDFVENINDEIAIIEVKAKTGRTKSAKTVLSNDNYAAKICYKLSENNIGVAGKMVTLPYYMAMFLN